MTNNQDVNDIPDYDNAEFLSLNWDCSADNLLVAVDELLPSLPLRGHRQKLKKHLKILLIHLIRIERYRTGTYLAYHRNNNIDTQHNSYNPFSFKFRTLRRVIDAMVANGMLDNVPGIRYGFFNRVSRCIATDRLRTFLASHNLTTSAFTELLPYEGIILKDTDKRIIHYEPEDTHQGLRRLLGSYNALISRCNIYLHPSPNYPVMLDRVQSYRIFNDGRFDRGGRFYGGWWTRIPKSDRQNIFINDEVTVELDYKANHLYLLYGLSGLQMPERLRVDPYTINDTWPRSLVKCLFMTIINASSDLSAYRALALDAAFKSWNRIDERRRKVTTLEEYNSMCDIFFEAHPIVREYAFQNYGSILMNTDSKIASYVLSRLTEEGIPCLCIHDSFIVPRSNMERLRFFMEKAYTDLGIPEALSPIREA